MEKVEKEKRKIEKELEDENGGVGVYFVSLKKYYILVDDEWKEDIMLEIFDGYNVYDFVDFDIFYRFEELEREEGMCFVDEVEDDFEMDGEELIFVEREVLVEIRRRKCLFI